VSRVRCESKYARLSYHCVLNIHVRDKMLDLLALDGRMLEQSSIEMLSNSMSGYSSVLKLTSYGNQTFERLVAGTQRSQPYEDNIRPFRHKDL